LAIPVLPSPLKIPVIAVVPVTVTLEKLLLVTVAVAPVAEVEFENLLPAVVAVKNLDTNATVVGDAIWSGQTVPWKSGPFIRDYLGQNSSDTPKDLLNCFELQTDSFK
jgi:hypothetical protein